MDLRINILDGDTISLSLADDSRLSDLKLAIRDHTGISEQEQRIIYLGHVLQEDKKLVDYNIHSGVCIQLVKIPVFVFFRTHVAGALGREYAGGRTRQPCCPCLLYRLSPFSHHGDSFTAPE